VTVFGKVWRVQTVLGAAAQQRLEPFLDLSIIVVEGAMPAANKALVVGDGVERITERATLQMRPRQPLCIGEEVLRAVIVVHRHHIKDRNF